MTLQIHYIFTSSMAPLIALSLNTTAVLTILPKQHIFSRTISNSEWYDRQDLTRNCALMSVKEQYHDSD